MCSVRVCVSRVHVCYNQGYSFGVGDHEVFGYFTMFPIRRGDHEKERGTHHAPPKFTACRDETTRRVLAQRTNYSCGRIREANHAHKTSNRQQARCAQWAEKKMEAERGKLSRLRWARGGDDPVDQRLKPSTLSPTPWSLANLGTSALSLPFAAFSQQDRGCVRL